MPRIANAKHLTLTDIADQLALEDAYGTDELRSKGSDLYVKEDKAAHTSLISRNRHRENAISLICHSLAAEFGITMEDARRVLTDVFGHVPSRITAGDVIRLHDLGKVARSLIADGTAVADAFDRAQQEKSPSENLSDPEGARSETSTGSEVPSERSETTFERPSQGTVTAPEGTGIMTTSSQGETQLSRKQARYNLAVKAPLMSALPTYEPCSTEQKQMWLYIAQQLGEPGSYPMDLLQALPIDQRISMQMALCDRLSVLRERKQNTPEQAVLAHAIVTLNKAYVLSDLIPDEEIRTLDSFLSEVGENPVLRNAYVHWKEMDEAQREKAIQTLIDLHAGNFGYADHKPRLVFEHTGSPKNSGSTNDQSLTINTNNANFGDFRNGSRQHPPQER